MNTRFQKFALAATLASGLAFGLPAVAQNSMPSSSDDAALVQQVKAALAQAHPLQDADVDIAVTASNGVVKLSGWLTYADDIATAEKIAEAVPGVKNVEGSFHIWSSSGRSSLY